MDLIARARGDEKHDESSYSTLDVIDVLYDVMRFDPERPDWEGRDRFILSKGHGPLAFYAVLDQARLLPRRRDGALPDVGRDPRRRTRTATACPASRPRPGSLGHGLPMAVGVAYALRARGADEQRVFVLTGDAELNEGSNWEAILHAGLGAALEPDADRGRQPLEHGGDGRHRRQARRVRLGRSDGRRARPRRAARGVRASCRRPDGGRGGGRCDDDARAGDGDRRRSLRARRARRDRDGGHQPRLPAARGRARPAARGQRRDHGAERRRDRRRLRARGLPSDRAHARAVPDGAAARADQARLRLPGPRRHVHLGRRRVRLRRVGRHAPRAGRHPGARQHPGRRGARARVGAARPTRCFARATRTAGRRTSARAWSRTASPSSSRPVA